MSVCVFQWEGPVVGGCDSHLSRIRGRSGLENPSTSAAMMTREFTYKIIIIHFVVIIIVISIIIIIAI